MSKIAVYYHAYADKDGDMCITLTEKYYWDENYCYDEYGESEHEEEISEAMEKCGTISTITPHYMPAEGVTVDSIIAKMKELGFEMLTNEEFADYCENG